MAGRNQWIVRLGETAVRRQCLSAELPPGLKLLGVVQRGAQYGVLALSEEGQYLQVNGDHVTPLGAAQIRHALNKAQSSRPAGGARPYRAKPAGTAPVPVVIIKRRRIPESA